MWVADLFSNLNILLTNEKNEKTRNDPAGLIDRLFVCVESDWSSVICGPK